MPEAEELSTIATDEQVEASTETAAPAAATETAAPKTEAAPAATAGKDGKTEQAPAAETTDAGDKGKGGKGGKATIATGADAEAEDAAKDKAAKPFWPENWREKAAEHYAAGDKKAYERELKRLQRITDPAAVYGQYRELEAKFTSGKLIQVPGKEAKEEEVAAFHKALGVPEKAEDYFKDVKLENGAVIGEADRPVADAFAGAVHKAGATPAVVNAAMNWYFKSQEDAAAALDEADDTFRRESERSLKDEYGPAFKRMTNSIQGVFTAAPGGTDIKNPSSLYARLMGGRMADGKLIGNDPDMVRFLVGIGTELNPAASVVEDGDQSGKAIDTEIAEIEKVMKEDRPEYDKKYANRYEQLLAARDKVRARQRA